MQYKTIVLRLLENSPALYQRLRDRRQLLEAVNHCSMSLKKRQKELTATLTQKTPGRHHRQLESEALEIAVEELKARLPSESHQPDQELSLDQAMAFILGSQHG